MIARLNGTLIQKSITHCVVDVNGTGYRVVVPLTTFYELPESGEQVVLQIHTHVREDAIHLYGFYTPVEREVFQLLISVSGIGPKLAVNILSGISAGELVKAVTGGDLKRLTGIPGVGKKTAERMVLELKEKAVKMERSDTAIPVPDSHRCDQIKEDALSALVNLGYRPSAAKEAVEQALSSEPNATLDRLLKHVLRNLAG